MIIRIPTDKGWVKKLECEEVVAKFYGWIIDLRYTN